MKGGAECNGIFLTPQGMLVLRDEKRYDMLKDMGEEIQTGRDAITSVTKKSSKMQRRNQQIHRGNDKTGSVQQPRKRSRL